MVERTGSDEKEQDKPEASSIQRCRMKSTIEINEANFEVEVLKSGPPVVVDFWAEWCGPCKMLAPVLEEIAAEQNNGVKVAKVNVDDHPALAARFGIRSIPTLLYFADGELRHQTVGVVNKKTILSNLPGRVVKAQAQGGTDEDNI
jgi:thioredoxin